MTSDNSSSPVSPNLPHQRSKPLRAGCRKEYATRRYLEERILHVSRRFTKKFQPIEEKRIGDVEGYISMKEVASDLGELANIVWLSATPNLQTQYLLSIAGIIIDYLPAFPSAPRVTFPLIKKMDLAFSSLLKGEDISTGKVLPGFSGSKNAGFSKTDMVRLKGLVEETRVLTVKILENKESDENCTLPNYEKSPDYPSYCDMEVARVYEHTIVQLGQKLERHENFQGY